MSQWGEERTVNHARLVPLIDGPAWSPIAPEHLIADVLLVDDCGDRNRAVATLEVAKRTMIGKPYHRWAQFRITFDDPTQPNGRNQRRQP